MRASEPEVIACEPTSLGMICLRRREIASQPGRPVVEITLDHQFLMSSGISASERALATRALEIHGGSELDVVVGGLGLGCTALEVLRSDRVRRLEVIELLPAILDWHARDLVPLAAELRADARFRVREADVYAWLASASERRVDLVLIDVDTAPDERLGSESGGFYTPAGLARARARLREGGVLGVWSGRESPGFEASLREVFARVEVEPVVFENDVLGGEETNFLYFAVG